MRPRPPTDKHLRPGCGAEAAAASKAARAYSRPELGGFCSGCGNARSTLRPDAVPARPVRQRRS
ncbi:MAG: hypothetical protein RKO24_07665, partial [Candidatus Competibacter sp.]|nr:hypothetical protein [Candidatus Competibacter sp.]